MEQHKCLREETFKQIRKELSELKEGHENMRTDVNELKESRAETAVYVKQILDKIDDLREMLASKADKAANSNYDIIMELIKLIGVMAAIIGGIKYFA